MKNEYKVESGVVTMEVQGVQAIFDESDFPKVDRFGSWKLSRGASIYTDFRHETKMCKITLHKLLTGSKWVKWLNGNTFDFRRENMAPIEKSIRLRPCGVYLKGNEYRIEKDTVIVLIKCKGEIHEAFIDYEDYPLVSKYTWNINPRHGYAQTRERRHREDGIKPIFMHRLVMDAQGFVDVVDHISGCKLDNRKANLRVCSRSENCHNNYRLRNGEIVGVVQTVDGTWRASLVKDRFRNDKLFKTKEEAITQRLKWEKELNPSGLNDANY